MIIQPFTNQIFVKKSDAEKVSKGGIAIAEGAASSTLQGTVVAVGPGKIADTGFIRPPIARVGDLVIFHVRRVEEVTVEGEKYLVGPEEAFYAILKNE